MALYHTDLFIPENLKLPAGAMLLEYSEHARIEAASDRYGRVELPSFIKFADYTPIEIEVQNGKVTKVLYRGRYDQTRDLCLVIIPQRRYVKTVWINTHSDRHHTLDTSKYDTK